MKVWLFDQNIAHADSWNDALEKGRPTANLEYAKIIKISNGIVNLDLEEIKNIESANDPVVLYSDKYFPTAQHMPANIKKIAWTMEPREYDKDAYNILEKHISDFDLVLTWDKELIEKYPDKCEFIPPDGVFIENYSVFQNKKPKSKLISHVYSNKQILEGHKLRHEIADWIKSNKTIEVDFWGSGSENPMEKKSESLNDYMFSIAIENNRDKNYFTDKILDCFATRTIPIYWGAPNIGDWFNLDGIITFETPAQLYKILEGLSQKDYWNMQSAMFENYEKSLEYYDYDDFIYRAIKRGLEKNV